MRINAEGDLRYLTPLRVVNESIDIRGVGRGIEGDKRGIHVTGTRAPAMAAERRAESEQASRPASLIPIRDFMFCN